MPDYIGSKLRFSDWIIKHIGKYFPQKLRNKSVIDCCSGSGKITQALTQSGASVLSIDVLKFANIMAEGSTVQNLDINKTKQHIDRINKINGVNGFFFNSYCPNVNRMYFTDDNARKIDACRQYIEVYTEGQLKKYLLYCAIEALSRVQNTSGHQVSYLKQFKSRALNKFQIKFEPIYPGNVKSIYGDIVELFKTKLSDKEYDAVYIDPPYNERQYGGYYHIYETFIRYDNPIIHGITGIRSWQNESKSDFCVKQKFFPYLFEIMKYCPSKQLFMSYNSDGLFSVDKIKDAINQSKMCNNFYTYSQPVQRYKQCKTVKTSGILLEYLFEINLY